MHKVLKREPLLGSLEFVRQGSWLALKHPLNQCPADDPRSYTKFHEEKLVLLSVIWWLVFCPPDYDPARERRLQSV